FWHGYRFFALERHHRGDHPRAQPLDIVVVTDDGDGERRAADMLDQQGQLDNLTDPAGNLEVAFNVNEREAVTAPGNEFGIVEAEFLPVPVFDQPVEHIEVMREVDDTGRIAMRKTNWNAAGKRAAGWHKTIFKHCAMLRSQPGEPRHLGP